MRASLTTSQKAESARLQESAIPRRILERTPSLRICAVACDRSADPDPANDQIWPWGVRKGSHVFVCNGLRAPTIVVVAQGLR